MKLKMTIAAVVAVLVLGYWAATPYLTVHKIKQAAEQKDAEALAEYVDFPSVRQSLKEQIKAAAMKEYAKDKELMENPFAALGIALIGSVVDNLIDTAVTPSGVAQLATAGIPKIDLQSGKVSNDAASTDGSVIQDSSMSYESLDKFSIKIKDRDGVEGRLVLRREGLFSWKLKDVQIQREGEGSFFSKHWAQREATADDEEVPAVQGQSTQPLAEEQVHVSEEAATDVATATTAAGTYAECMEQAEGISPIMLDCTLTELKKQDARLNAAYKQAMDSLSDKVSLRDAQRQWIKLRDKECEEQAAEFEGGTAYGLLLEGCILEKTQKRADELEALI